MGSDTELDVGSDDVSILSVSTDLDSVDEQVDSCSDSDDSRNVRGIELDVDCLGAADVQDCGGLTSGILPGVSSVGFICVEAGQDDLLSVGSEHVVDHDLVGGGRIDGGVLDLVDVVRGGQGVGLRGGGVPVDLGSCQVGSGVGEDVGGGGGEPVGSGQLSSDSEGLGGGSHDDLAVDAEGGILSDGDDSGGVDGDVALGVLDDVEGSVDDDGPSGEDSVVEVHGS